MKKLYIVFFSICAFFSLQAQISKGKLFWFSFLQNYYSQSGEMRVYITSETPCSGTISSPLQGWFQNFTVTPGVSTQIVVPHNIGENFDDDQISDKAIRIATTECVSVFAHWYQTYTSDAAVIFPVNSIGREYIIQAWYNPSMNNGNSQFAIIGTENNTQIQITLPINENGHIAGVPYTIFLDSGQVYQLQSHVDLTGTRIVGLNNKNFAVMAGHVCANVGNCGYCDMLYEQMYPLSSWGTEFITVPYATRDYDIFRIVAQQNGTQVTINGGAPINLNAGQVHQYSSSVVSLITSNKPISVVQYSTGSDCDANMDPYGDPFMIVLSPTSQTINQVTFTAFPNPDPQFTYYVNVIAKTNDLGALTFDGGNIAGSFLPVSQNPAYSYARLTITQGDHTISAPQGVVAYVYGYGPYESYGYAAGVRVQIPFLSVYDTSKLYCPNDTVKLSLNTPDTSRIIYIEWDLGDGSPHVFNTFHVTHVYPNYGEYPIRIIYELESACKKDTAVIDTVKIRGPNVYIQGPTQFCAPQNSVTYTYTSQFPLTGVIWSTGSTANSVTISAPHDTILTIIGQNATCYGYDTARIYVASDTAGFTFNNTCLGNATVFTNTSKLMPGVYYTWQWNFGDGSPPSAAISPTHTYSAAGTYQVKLKYTSSIGCTDSIIRTVTITAKPTASFSFTHVCNDSIFSPLNTSTISGGSMTYAWNFGDGSPVNTQQNPQHEYAQSGLYNVQLIASSAPGCADTFARFVNVIIGADLNFAGTSVCLGSSTQFTNLTVNNSGSAVLDYKWYFGDGDSSTALNPVHTYLNSGTYNVTLTANYGSSCTESIVKPITVHPRPDAQFTVADVCNSGTVQPVNTSTISNGTMTYSWNFGDGSAPATGNAPAHTYQQSGNYTITLIATSNASCKDTASATVNVIRGTLIDFSAPPVCEGNTTIFTNQTTNPYNTNILSYTWNFGDGNTSQAQNPSHTYASGGTYNVKLVLNYGNNCADSLTKPVTVNHKPAANFTVADVCNSGTVQPVNTSTISNGTMTYSWNFGDGSAPATGNAPAHTYQQSGNYTITLIATSNASCKDTASATVNVIRGTLIDFSAPPVCEGNTTIFTNQTTNPYNTNILSYHWNFGDGNTSTQQNTSHTYAADGTYHVKLVLNYGNNCADSLTKPVTVHNKPVADFTVNDVCNTGTVQPTNNSQSLIGTYTYLWTFGDGTSSTLANPTHTYSLSNTYLITLVVTTNFNCKDTLSHPVNVIMGTNLDFTAPAVCEGNPTLFTNQTANPYNTNIQSYHWNFGDGNTSNAQNPSHTYGSDGTYQVKLVLQYGNNCADSLTKPVVVHDKPVASFTSDSVCHGQATTLTSTSTPANNIQNHWWHFGDGGTAQGATVQHTYPAAGNYAATLMVATAQSCYDTATGNVYVMPLPPVSFTAAPVCPGNATTFINLTDTTTHPYTLSQWSFGDGNTASAFSGSHQYASSGTYSVTLQMQFVMGCANSVTQNVTVFASPSVSSTVTNVSCYGGSNGAIQLTPQSGQIPFQYNWSNNLQTEDLNGISANTYTVTFTDANQCTGSASYTVNEPPMLQLSLSAQEITCHGYSDGAIAVNLTGGTPGYSFAWNNGSNSANLSQIGPGYYSITVTDANGCTVTDQTTLQNPPPLTILLNPIDSVRLGQHVQLNASAINGNVTTWLWTPADYLSCTDCPDPLAAPYQDFIYTVTAYDEKGCTDTAQVRIIVISDGIIFVPNVFTPNGDGVNDYFEVYGNKEAWKHFHVAIFNRTGEKVYESNDMYFRWDGSYKGVQQAPQVFVYLINLVYLNNRSEEMFKGSVTLMR